MRLNESIRWLIEWERQMFLLLPSHTCLRKTSGIYLLQIFRQRKTVKEVVRDRKRPNFFGLKRDFSSLTFFVESMASLSNNHLLFSNDLHRQLRREDVIVNVTREIVSEITVTVVIRKIIGTVVIQEMHGIRESTGTVGTRGITETAVIRGRIADAGLSLSRRSPVP